MIIIGYAINFTFRYIANVHDTSAFPVVFMIIKIILAVISGAFILPLCYMYAIEALPERGFTLVITLHWISLILFPIPRRFFFPAGTSIFTKSLYYSGGSILFALLV